MNRIDINNMWLFTTRRGGQPTGMLPRRVTTSEWIYHYSAIPNRRVAVPELGESAEAAYNRIVERDTDGRPAWRKYIIINTTR